MTTTILHVGFTGTGNDHWRISKVMDWLRLAAIKYPDKSLFMDLTEGEDFLIDTGTYDMVVLHFISREEKCHQRRRGRIPKELTVSEHASWYNWCRRLIATEAGYLFLFGGFGEVSWSYVAGLGGYKCVYNNVEDELAVFIKGGR